MYEYNFYVASESGRCRVLMSDRVKMSIRIHFHTLPQTGTWRVNLLPFEIDKAFL